MDVLRIRLGDEALEACLLEQARRERRRPADQAAYLLEKCLREAPREPEREPCGQVAVS